MHTINLAAFAGIGFLAIGTTSAVSDQPLFHTSYGLLAGPIFWIVGCALMVAWAIGRVGLATSRGADTSDEPSALKEKTFQERRAKSETPASDSRKKAVAGHVVADFLAPLAIWLIIFSIIATIVLLLGYGPA